MTRTGSLTSILVLCALGTALVPTALAHVQGNTIFMDNGGWGCMFGRAAISPHNPDYTSTTVWSYVQGCGAFKNKDPGKLRTRENILKQQGDGTFYQCAYGDFGYNSTTTYATSTLEQWSGAPCNHGYYKVGGHTGIYDSGTWHTGSVDSPGHDW
jgi:hypothetical protein